MKSKKLIIPAIAACFACIIAFAGAESVFGASAITVPVKSTGYEAQLTNTYTITQASPRMDNITVGHVIPLTVTAPGTIRIDVSAQRLDKYLDGGIFTDPGCTNRLQGAYINLEPGDQAKTSYASVTTAGTYYMKLSASCFSSNPGVFTNTITVGLGEYTRTVKNLKSKVQFYRINGKDVWRFKYKATKTGKVYFKLNSGYGYYVKLENAKKKALNTGYSWVSSNNDEHNGRIGYAVKKGQTYHFAVKSIAGNELQTASVSKVTAIKEKSGKSLKKARKLKAKKKTSGMILPAESKADWYKITVPKKKAVTIYMSGETNVDQNFKDGLAVTVYTKKGKKVGSDKFRGPKSSYELTYGRTYGKVNKGTYYIKVSRLNKRSSGFYTLSWK